MKVCLLLICYVLADWLSVSLLIAVCGSALLSKYGSIAAPASSLVGWVDRLRIF